MVINSVIASFCPPCLIVETEYQLSVFDVLGKLYYRENFFATEENVHKVISIKDLNRGYYTIQIVGPQFRMNTGLMID
mgnify:CR=1 FL=1